MAVDPAGRRQDGVRALTAEETRGSGASQGYVNLPESTYRNPGPTPNLRGIEPNTGKSEGSNVGDPLVFTTPAGEFDTNQRSAPFNTPDSSGVNAAGDDGVWDSADSSARNSHELDVIPHDAFSAFGETYPGNARGTDGRS